MTTYYGDIKMPEQKQKQKPDLDDFLSNDEMKDIAADINIESIKAMLKAGEIVSQLKIAADTVYTVEVIGKPKTFKSNYGQTLALPIKYEGMKRSLIVPKSLKIQLLVAMIRKEYDFDTLVNKHLKVLKTKGNTKEYKDAMLYTCEIID